MYYVIIDISVEGFHRWENAPERLDFLRYRHRHIFNIKAYIKVEHNDRDIEIIETSNKIKGFLYQRFGNPCEFGCMSCEMISKLIAEQFNAFKVETFEDKYNGGAYFKE